MHYQPPDVRFRAFDDIDTYRSDIYEQAASAFRDFAPLQNVSHRLEVQDVGYDGDYNPTLADEKKAIMSRQSLHRPLKGTLALYDQETGQLLDQQRTTLAHIPHLNQRGLFVRKGIVWSPRNQERLRPGIYGRKRKDGGTEAQFNVEGGRGYRIELDPKSGLFRLRVGQSTTRLYPLLRQLGISDEELKERWGKKLFQANFREPGDRDRQDLVKVARKFAGDDTEEDLALEALTDALGKARIDPEVARATLGREVEHVDPQVLADVSQKVLAISRGEAAEDVRDSQRFQSIHSAEDFIRDRLRRDKAGGLRRLLWKAAKEGKLNAQAGVLNKNIDAIFDGTGLMNAVEDINPIEILDQRQAITRMGEGGISSEQAVSREARGVQPSYLGIIDAVRGPECYDPETEVMTDQGWIRWPDVNESTRFACLVDGVTRLLPAEKIHRSHYRGPMFGAASRHISYLVTPNHRMWVQTCRRSSNGKYPAFRVAYAADVHEKHRRLLSNFFAPVEVDQPVTEFVLPDAPVWHGSVQKKGAPSVGARTINNRQSFDIVDWAAFIGWFLTEGNVYIPKRDAKRRSYTTQITQSRTASADRCHEIEQLLDRLGMKWSYTGSSYSISGKQLACYLSQFGKSNKKFIPEYLFNTSVEARTALMDALMKGDGKHWHGSEDDVRALHTTSQQLADGFERLAFSLGRSTKRGYDEDDRKEAYLPVHSVYLHSVSHHTVAPAKLRHRTGVSDFYTREYDGDVYCATVPGGLLYVRRAGCCGFWCGNSSRLGLDLRAASSALKGSDGRMYARVRDRNDEEQIISAAKLGDSVLAFPGELGNGEPKVLAIKEDKLQYVDPTEVDYEVPSGPDMFSIATNLIPFAEGIKGQRLLMGTRMAQQSLPVAEPEAPLVRTTDGRGESLHRRLGELAGARRASVDGVVKKVEPDRIVLQTADGPQEVQLFNHYPTARKTTIHNTPLVEPGQQVKKGDLLARSNFTDEEGILAIGRNLRSAWVVAEGDTLEDAFVISESAAQKMAGVNAYREELKLDEVEATDKRKYRSIYTDKFTDQQYEKIGDDGVITVGAEVREGDPIILGFGKKKQRAVGAVIDSPRAMHSDYSVTWDHESPGTVTDVIRTRKGIQVQVSSTSPMKAGDKLATRFGAKGVISRVLPDEQMPVGQDGQPMDLLINALGITSRVNPAALAEAALGKVAALTGKPYDITNFNTPQGVIDFAIEELERHGIPPSEALYDPRSGRTLEEIFTGLTYVTQLHHRAEGKQSARDTAGYTLDGTPAKGSGEGSKRIGTLDVGALLASGSTEFLRDAKLIRGQRNDEYWRAIKTGQQPQIPTTNFANEHFKAQLKAAGVNIREEGTIEQLAPLLDSDVRQMSAGAIKSGKTFDFETMKPVEGGLFDPAITGGADGLKFAHIELPEAVPHPLFLEPIQSLLGLTGKRMDAVLSGEEELNGTTGPSSVATALQAIDIDREIQTQKEVIKKGKKSVRDRAVKRLNYLTGLQRTGTQPGDLMVKNIPVIPPKFRPIVSGRGMDIIHDLNYLYNDLMEASENYRQASSVFGEAGSEYLTLSRAVQAVSGLHQPVNQKTVDQNVKGILKTAIGVQDTPKAAFYQRKVIGTAVDTVGRGVITSDPNLSMDEVGVPRDMAWKIFRPYVMRRLVHTGHPATKALEMVDEQDPQAEKALMREMEVRPVVYNRAPALHQYNYVAAYGKVRDDDAIGLNYYTLEGQAADFDGDSGRFLLALKKVAHMTDAQGGPDMPVASETSIITTQGVEHIQDLELELDTPYESNGRVDKYRVRPGQFAYAYNCRTGVHDWAEITEFSVHRNLSQKAVIVGKQRPVLLTVSDDHSLICYKDGVVDKRRPDECIGLMAPVAKHLGKAPVDERKTVLAEDSITYRDPAGVNGQATRSRRAEIPLDYAFGRFIGIIVGDGWVDSAHHLYIASNYPEIAEALEDYVSSDVSPFDNKTRVITYKRDGYNGDGAWSTRIQIGCSWFARWLRRYIGSGAENKRIPSWCLNAPRECLLGLLDGLLSTDGSVSFVQPKSKRKGQLQIGYDTTSPDLVNSLSFVLKRLGVGVSATPYRGKNSRHTCYRLSLSTPDFKRLVKQDGFSLLSEHKASVLEQRLPDVDSQSAVASRMDLVPYPAHLHSVMVSAFPDATHKSAANAGRRNGYWSRNLAQRFIQQLEDVDGPGLDRYRSLVGDASITWQQVQSVTDVTETVGYDITVPGPYTFATADGVFVQDTINIHVPSSDSAVEEVKRTLMPSQNLISAADFKTRFKPMQDYIAGLYMATEVDNRKPARKFSSREEAIAAYKKGEIGPRDPIEIQG